MKRILTLLLLIAAGLSAFAQAGDGSDTVGRNQDPEAFRTVYGRVLDTRSDQPVAYASVTLEGTGLSNVTNAEGFFSLKIPEDTPADAVVSLHHLGYLNASRSIQDFCASTPDRPLLIRMAQMSIELDPSLIRSIDPGVLMRTAFRHVRDNYPQEHEHLTAFYREMIRKGNIKYLALNEAVVDIDKMPYSGFSSDRAAIYKGRGSRNFQASDTLFVHFQGGIMGTLSGDVVKDPFVGVLLENVDKYYDLSVEGSATIDGHDCIILCFREKPNGEDVILYDGRLFIDSDTYAIARVEYAMNVKGREERAAGRFVIKKPADFRFRVDKAAYFLNFKQGDGTWHFDYSRMELQFNARRKRTLFSHNYSIVSEMAVTDRKAEVFKISNQEKVKFNEILSDRVSDFTDPAFWGSYNVIEPDQSIENAIKRIIRQLKARNDNPANE